jgi:2,4-dienoyl-CoA reductase-like NADH-dependent reductase (Old Yellow Enzyme family)
MIINTPFNLGSITPKNILPPMTRAWCSNGTNVPNEFMAEYYEQQAVNGLLISEAIAMSPVR